MRGEASSETYLQYLVDLKCIYLALEIELDQHYTDPKLAAIIVPDLFRSKKLEKDILFFIEETGIIWPSPSQEAFALRNAISDCASGAPYKLAAYCYITILGDLFGDTSIGFAIERAWGKDAANFYNYAEFMKDHCIQSLFTYTDRIYRPKFNQLNLNVEEENALISEIKQAYVLIDALFGSYEWKRQEYFPFLDDM